MKTLLLWSAFALSVANALWIPFISNRQKVLDAGEDLSSDTHDDPEDLVPYIKFIKELSESEVGFNAMHTWKKGDDDDHKDDPVPPGKLPGTHRKDPEEWNERPHHARKHKPHHPPKHHAHPHCKHKPVHNPENDQQNLLEVIGNDKRFKILSKLVNSQDEIANKLKDQNSELTVFAPGDWAFKRAHRHMPHHKPPPPEVIGKVLAYHIVAEKLASSDFEFGDILETSLVLDSLGGKPQVLKVFAFHNKTFVNFARVFDADIAAKNGVVHGITKILLPPPPTLKVLWFFKRHFAIFLGALKHTGLIDDVRDKTGITVFAPPNRAFLKLGRNKLKELFKNKEELKALLLYHIVPQIAYSKTIIDGDSESLELPTFNGDSKLTLTVEAREWKNHKFKVVVVNGNSTVVFPDALTAQGTIHVVNNVIAPPSDADRKEAFGDELWDGDVDDVIEYLTKQ